MKMRGGWNRVLAGMPLIMMTARGPGHIAFSADHPGETLAMPLQQNQAVDVVEHRFLVATGNVNYQWENSGVWFTTRNGDDRSRTTRSARRWTGSAPRAARPAAAARPGQHLHPRPGARRAHPASSRAA